MSARTPDRSDTDMTDRNEIPRRRLLGALGTVGGAAAFGGAGTVAVFSDEERFANDRLAAGEVDLKVGWDEHYSDWSADESIEGVQMQSNSRGFPVSFADDDVQEAFMRTTRQERFPAGGLDGSNPCTTLTDVPAELSSRRPVIELSDVKPGDFGEVTFDLSLCDNPGYLWLDADLLESTENGQTEPESKDPDELSDDDPATSGPETVLAIENDRLTVVLFGGSGVFWTYTFPDGRIANALLLEFFTLQDGSASGAPASSRDVAFEGSFPTPGVPGTNYSATAPFEVNGATIEVTRTVELDPVDPLLAVDYEFEVLSGGPVDLVFTQFVDYDLGQATGDTARFRRDAARDFDYVEQVDERPIERIGAAPIEDRDLFAGFGANRVSDAHDVGEGDDLDPTDGSNTPFDRVTTGQALAGQDVFGPGDAQFALEYSLGPLETGETVALDGAFALADSPQVLRSLLVKRRLEFAPGDLADAVQTTLWYDTDGDNVLDEGEEVFFEGSLAQLLALASTGTGLPLDGDRSTPFDEGDDDPTSEGRDCFAPTPTVHDVGFLWELPVDHANELQGDDVAFDFGFYAEQCRHNDGRGHK
ncbi:hypothetical protein [Salinigranum salinum]|uniref:hypothetical protein n=1 Tax=Salinigranum salinum TaxID=1364937 RepID=UPI00126139F7|nr:hypothetical protein [Salinigranum salinum]